MESRAWPLNLDTPRRPVPRTLPHRWTRVDPPGEEAVVAAFDTVIAGAGPAGLTAAFELSRHGHPCVTLEADPHLVGGISRTDTYKGYRFDIGGHRFFSKSAEVNRIWHEILGDDLIERPRLSRIYYDRKFFHYPLKPADALLKLGPVRSARILASYLKAQLRPIRPERSFEDWVVNRFGRLLFEIFFKTYTEKVWGLPTSSITADWAAQRIKGLSLTRKPSGTPSSPASTAARTARSSRPSSTASSTPASAPARCGKPPATRSFKPAAPCTWTAASSGSSTTAPA